MTGFYPAFNRILVLDDNCSNYIIDHNVIWNCEDSAIRLNSPSNYNLIYNNTAAGKLIANYGLLYSKDYYSTKVFNNIFTDLVDIRGGVIHSNNIFNTVDPIFVDENNFDFSLQSNSPAIDNGMFLQQITSGYYGNKPDCGAYEYGVTKWSAGHNFSTLIDPNYSEPTGEYCNLVNNGDFENNSLNGWTKTGTQNAVIVYGDAWASIIANARTGVRGVKFGSGINGIEQTIDELNSNTIYTFSAWVKAEPLESIEVGIKDYGGTLISKSISENMWTHITLDFTTGISNTSATIYISKNSNGTNAFSYCDDIGVVKKDIESKTQSFESDFGSFSTATGTKTISSNKSHTGSSSYIVDQDTDVITLDTGKYYKKSVRLWLYDDDTKSDVIMMARADETPSNNSAGFRGLGVNTNASKNTYVFRIASSYYPTNIKRKTGWHELKWDYTSGNNLYMYIDGTLVAEDNNVTAFRYISMGDWWADQKIANLYFDDFEIIDSDLDNGTFENGISGWSTQNTPKISTYRYKSGGNSYALDEDVDVISKTFSSNINNIVKIWMYDYNGNTIVCSAKVDDGTNYRGLGIDSTISTTNYVVINGSNKQDTGIPRSTGWHELKWDYTSGSKLDLYIDNYFVGSFTGVSSFCKISVGDFDDDNRIASGIYFDDISICGHNSLFVECFENGLSKFTNVAGTPTTSSSIAYSGLNSYVVDQDVDMISKNFINNTNGIVTLMMYDNATDSSLLVMARVDSATPSDSLNWRGIGVNTNISSNKYVFRVGNVTTATNITRTTGWHELKWDYTSGSKVDLYIDGVLISSPTGITFFKQVTFGDTWTDSKIGPVYFDDLVIQ